MATLTINSGSSSLKFGLYADDGVTLILSGKVDGIGHGEGSLSLADAQGRELEARQQPFALQGDALTQASALLTSHSNDVVTAIGHRMVHGGPHLREHCALTEQVLQTLEDSVHFAPLHIPPALKLVRATQGTYPEARQFACFDTQFHTTLPPEASTYAIPLEYRDAGVQRYGFHGLSYASLVRQLGSGLARKTVAAHLGGGSSLCALLAGRSLDTSMGASPCGGVPMATRSGDLDPGVALLLERALLPGQPPLTPDQVETMLNHAGGMQALAGESDTRVLTTRAESGDDQARLALDIFTRSVAKYVAAYASVLDGLQMLVFTGGIGEHSTSVRQAVCARLGFLGVDLDPAAAGPVLSRAGSAVQVLVQSADEDGQIALEVQHLLSLA